MDGVTHARCKPDYLTIAEHGVIGDQRSVALVGTDGTIDWYCPDRFDGPSVFAAILDRQRGGFYRIAPLGSGSHTKQMYLPETNVLITRFLSPEGVSEVQDFMPLGTDRQHLIRRVVDVRGCVPFRLELDPRFDCCRPRSLRCRRGTTIADRRRSPAAPRRSPLARRTSPANGVRPLPPAYVSCRRNSVRCQRRPLISIRRLRPLADAGTRPSAFSPSSLAVPT